MIANDGLKLKRELVTTESRALAFQQVMFVCFPLSGWEPEYGGFTSYIAKGEDEEVSYF
jgi:hypothetical protein